jgi:hypothetical protein
MTDSRRKVDEWDAPPYEESLTKPNSQVPDRLTPPMLNQLFELIAGFVLTSTTLSMVRSPKQIFCLSGMLMVKPGYSNLMKIAPIRIGFSL